MRKLLLALPLVAGFSWAGSTYYAGGQTQTAYDHLISQLNQLKPFTVVSEEYNSGFISSTAITKVMDSTGPDASVLFRLKHVIQHSPVGVDDAGTRIGASNITTTLMTDSITDSDVLELLASFEGGEPFELLTRVGLSGDIVNDLVLNRLELQESDGTVTFDGGQYTIVSDGHGKVSGSGELGALQMATDGSKVLDVTPAPMTFELTRIADGLYSGNTRFDIPSIKFANPVSGSIVVLEGISFASDSRMTGESLYSDASMQITRLDSPLPIDSASWDVSMNDLSIDGLIKYQEIMQTVSMADSSNGDPMVLMEKIKQAYSALLTAGIGVETGVVVTNSGGSISTSMNLKYLGYDSSSGRSIETLRDALMSFTMSITLDADVTAIDQTPAAMLMMHPMAEDYVLNDGQRYTASIKLADLIMNVNGDPRSLESIVGPMLDMPVDSVLPVQ